ncbi:MAG: PilT/PilU family type 4a pilus ATPase [Phascolarctobacterium sp.]|nr:PilT/PilU family type 4a pilus ATPase [Phascolarctobacterium sp.]
MKQLYELFSSARDLGASDIHITPNEVVSFRINGVLQKTMLTFSEEQVQKFVQGILNEEQYANLEQGAEIDCSFLDDKQGYYRVNAFKSFGSFVLAIRIINSTVPNCEELGLPEEVCSLANLKQGLVLVCGATGSGKSTTLAALLNKINCECSVHIVTLEDPIEYRHVNRQALIHQREVASDTASFVTGLRSALRQDHDVILVGELRDKETTAAALNAAETGHLVFATLHSREATGAINRILDMFDEGRNLVCNQLANVLEGIVCQELVIRVDGSGRKANFEVLLASPALRSLIREGRSHQINGYQMLKYYK